MTETLQGRVSRLFSEKPWGHKQPTTKSGLAFISYDQRCVKCKGVYDARNPSDCPVPDPIDITDLGKALETFRITWKGSYDEYMAGFIQTVMRPQNTWSMDDAECVAFFISMAFKDATPAQIWTMCCDAKEGE